MATTREDTSASNAESDDDSSTQPVAKASFGTPKQWTMAFIFMALGLGAFSVAPSMAIGWTCAILLFTVYLFVFEVVSVDVTAISIMVLLGLTTLLAPYLGLEQGLVDNQQIFDGFASNAVISIIAVMIIGAGLDKTGVMSRLARYIVRIGGTSETRVIPIVSATVGFISSFMQNIGAAALFLPVVSRISNRSGVPMSRLLMPMGFCAILGGTVTMVGSSPLILLNDLILASNQVLPEDQAMETWSLFSVTPIGVALLLTGIAYFVVAGRYVLPDSAPEGQGQSSTLKYFQDVYGLDYGLFEVVVPTNSPLVGQALQDIESPWRIRVVAVRTGNTARIGPGSIARDFGIDAGTTLGILASPVALEAFVNEFGLTSRTQIRTFVDELSPATSGIAEIVVPPNSSLVGNSARDIWMRKTYGMALIALHRAGETFREGDGIRRMEFQPGDVLVVHITWESLTRLKSNRDFVVVTTEFPHEELRPQKVPHAAFFFAIALGLVLFSDLRLSIALLTGAIGMVLSGVLRMEEAYEAISWKTVFLLASLIPLGFAVETSGTARWVAENIVAWVGEMPPWIIQDTLALLATAFTLVMSNVGATVLLVPLAVNIALNVGADPAVYALTVAIATSNSFLIPTHQVNALIMGPGGYRVPDFMRAGGIMTILFLVVSVTALNLLY